MKILMLDTSQVNNGNDMAQVTIINISGDASDGQQEMTMPMKMSPSFSSRIKTTDSRYEDDYRMGATRIVKIDGKDFLVGSMIYAEQDTQDFTANFVISPLEAGGEIAFPYPQ